MDPPILKKNEETAGGAVHDRLVFHVLFIIIFRWGVVSENQIGLLENYLH